MENTFWRTSWHCQVFGLKSLINYLNSFHFSSCWFQVQSDNRFCGVTRTELKWYYSKGKEGSSPVCEAAWFGFVLLSNMILSAFNCFYYYSFYIYFFIPNPLLNHHGINENIIWEPIFNTIVWSINDIYNGLKKVQVDPDMIFSIMIYSIFFINFTWFVLAYF